MTKNIFVLGLDELNHAVLKRSAAAQHCTFHQLLTLDELRQSNVSGHDLLAKAERQLDAFDGSIDGIVGFWGFPSTVMVPILSSRRGLTSASLEAVVKCEHKYWSRLVQQAAIQEYPAFGLLDLDDPAAALPPHMSYPVWIKPISSRASQGAHYIDNEQQLPDMLRVEREEVRRLAGPFRQLLEAQNFPEHIVTVTDSTCMVEEAATGQQATVEGFAHNGEVHAYGIVDSISYGHVPSFLRYQYPSTRLSPEVQERMREVSRRVIKEVGLDNSTFNIEFFWDPGTETLTLLEINARHSQSHAIMLEHVDGISNHSHMVDLVLGREPVLVQGGGRYGVSAKWMVRTFADGVVTRVPSYTEIAACEAAIDGVVVQLNVQEGDRLSHNYGNDSFSYELAEIYIGAADEDELLAKYERCLAMLTWDIEDVDNPEDLDTMGRARDIEPDLAS